MSRPQDEIQTAAQEILKFHPAGLEVERFAIKMGFPVENRSKPGREAVYRLTSHGEADVRMLVKAKVIEVQEPTPIRASTLVHLHGQVPAKKAMPGRAPVCTTTIDPRLKGSWKPSAREKATADRYGKGKKSTFN